MNRPTIEQVILSMSEGTGDLGAYHSIEGAVELVFEAQQDIIECKDAYIYRLESSLKELIEDVMEGDHKNSIRTAISANDYFEFGIEVDNE